MVDHCLDKNDVAGLNKGWEIVKRNNVFLKDLVLDMLTYAKEREPELMPCNVNELVESVGKLSAAESERRGVALDCRPADDFGEVMLDGRAIKRCLLNLIGNATDASEGRLDPRVVLETRKVNENTLCISVSDNGCGIAEEDMARLFQVFFSTKGSKGTGLGLAVTHKIVSEHGGRIHVESTIDEGTTFSIYLPTGQKEPRG
jgi:signal transduction histidine kinase